MKLLDMLNKTRISLKLALFIIFFAILILCVTIAWSLWKREDDQIGQFSIHIVEPTCTENGYSIYTHIETRETTIRDLVDAKGHTFDPWVLIQDGNEVNCSFFSHVCAVCGFEQTRAEYPSLSISRISLYGDLEGIGKKQSVPMEAYLELKEDGLSIECYATLKYQGHTSLSYDKKNYTLKLFKDEERQDKYKLTLGHWNKENKYILKANYVDASQCRNLVSAQVWANMCAMRQSLPEEFKTLSNYGAVDGYPIAVYINDQFHGLFTMNLHKDDDLFAMKDNARHAIMICNYGDSPEATFHAEAEFTDNSPWEVEYCGTEDATWAKESFNQLIRFVRTSDDETFRRKLSEYLDVEAAIDYLIALYAFGLTNHTDQDLLFVNYGDVWIPSLYDMETAFGLSEDGSYMQEPTVFLPTRMNSGWDSGTGHLLWNRLLWNFEDEICARYQVLRPQILDPQMLCNRVTAFTDGIPVVIYEAEETTNPHPISYKESIIQILNYIPERIEKLDAIFLRSE